MATSLQLAQSIESDYTIDSVVTVKICRPDMTTALSGSNLPYIRELNSLLEQQTTGIVKYSYLSEVLTSNNTRKDLLDNIRFNVYYSDANTCYLTGEGDTILKNYRYANHPAGTEQDSVWTAICNHLVSTRGAVLDSIERVHIVVGSPISGTVNAYAVETGVLKYRTYYVVVTYGTGWEVVSYPQG